MTFKEMEEEKKKVRDLNISYENQCAQMVKFIEENKVKTIKGGKNGKGTKGTRGRRDNNTSRH